MPSSDSLRALLRQKSRRAFSCWGSDVRARRGFSSSSTRRRRSAGTRSSSCLAQPGGESLIGVPAGRRSPSALLFPCGTGSVALHRSEYSSVLASWCAIGRFAQQPQTAWRADSRDCSRRADGSGGIALCVLAVKRRRAAAASRSMRRPPQDGGQFGGLRS